MKTIVFLVTLLSGVSLHAQPYGYRPFDVNDTVLHTVVGKQVPGCACAYTSLYPQLMYRFHRALP
jgi:hypothetical protein